MLLRPARAVKGRHGHSDGAARSALLYRASVTRRAVLRPTGIGLALLAALCLVGCTGEQPVTERHAPTVVASSPAPSTVPLVDRGDGRQAHGTATQSATGGYEYVIAAGDTLEGIAARFGTTPDHLATLSRGGFEIFAGDVLRIERTS